MVIGLRLVCRIPPNELSKTTCELAVRIIVASAETLDAVAAKLRAHVESLP